LELGERCEDLFGRLLCVGKAKKIDDKEAEKFDRAFTKTARERE